MSPQLLVGYYKRNHKKTKDISCEPVQVSFLFIHKRPSKRKKAIRLTRYPISTTKRIKYLASIPGVRVYFKAALISINCHGNISSISMQNSCMTSNQIIIFLYKYFFLNIGGEVQIRVFYYSYL